MQLGLAFVTGSHTGTVVKLGNNSVVGTDPFCDIVLKDVGADSRHVQLYAAGHGYQLLDLRSIGGTFVNGMRVPPGQPIALPLGGLLCFGEGGPLAIFDDTSAFQEQPLTLVREDSGEVFPIAAPLVLGRSRSCDLQLHAEADAVASSKHLHVMAAFGRLVITDLGSANGTFLPGNIRITQAALTLGGRVNLGGEGGPWFRVDTTTAAVPAPSSMDAPSLPAKPSGPEPIPESFKILVTSGNARGRIEVACKPEVQFGSFAGLCEFEVTTFPRELENEHDAAARGESIDPQHGTLVLTQDGVDLIDGGEQLTKLNGDPLPTSSRQHLREGFDLSLGDDVVGLRGRIFRHPRLQPTAPRIGMEGQHPVECLVMERSGDGDTESRLYLMLVRQASIGSSDDAAICLPYPGVAPLHASLYIQDERLWISQAGDMPVAVDGVPLAPGKTMPLRIGSSVYVGATKFELTE